MKTSIALLATLLSGTSAVAQVTPKQFAPGAAATNLGYSPLNPASNLADVTNAATARGNLGLGSFATISSLYGLDASQASVTAIGSGALARSLLSHFGEVVDVADYCPVLCSSIADRTAAFQKAGTVASSTSLGATIWVPPGKWDYDASLAGGPLVFTQPVGIAGGGVNSTTVRVYNGSFAKWSATSGSMQDIRLFEADNPGSGVQVSLTNVNLFDMSNVMLGGGCVDLELASAVAVHGTNITIQGNNTNGSCAPGSVATGVTGMWVHRASTGAAGNNSENNFTNLNVRSGIFYQMTNSLVISNSDGLVLTNGHAGMTSGDVVLFQPEYANDQINNVFSIGVFIDINQAHGYHFAPYAGAGTPIDLNNIILGGGVANAASDGILVDDPAVHKLEIIGTTFNNNTGNAINLQAGNNISLTGDTYSQNANGNTSGSGTHYSDVLIGGTTTGVAISGGTYENGLANSAPEYHVLVQDSADRIVVGTASYRGASLGDFHKTISGDGVGHVSTGTNIQTPVSGVTDQGANQAWPVFRNITSTGGTLGSGFNTNVFTWQTTAGSNGNVNIAEAQANASGTPARLFATGADGLAAGLTLGDNGGTSTGPTFVGNPTGGVTLKGPLTLTSLAVSPVAPTIASGFCTTPSVGAGANGTSAFIMTIGTACAVSTGALTMPAAAHGWHCNASSLNAPGVNKPDTTAYTTTSVTLTNYSRTTGVAANWTSSDVLDVDCHGF